ncbi:MAG: amidohydrolase family protein, partial [bacterium]|nr:amidohydrolase family protein [bacterium]
MHSHAFPDALAPKAIDALEARADWKAFGTGTIDARLKSMDDAGIDVAVICTIATRPELTEGILRWCCSIRSERIVPFASVHPRSDDAVDWIRRIVDAGIQGIKMHSVYQDYCVDDPTLDGIYAAASDAGLIVTPHCGRDTAAPDDINRASPERIARVIEKFPDLKLVCTHMGGWRMWDEVQEHLIGKNCPM